MPSRVVRLAPWLLALVATVFTTAGLVWTLDPEPEAPIIRDGALLVVDREALATVDLAQVHEELIPDWVVSSGGLKRLHFDRIRREAGKDPNLGALLDRIRILFEADPVLNASELLALVRVWNTYLAKAGEPWRLAGEVRVGGTGGELFLKSYRVIVNDGQVRVGDQTFRAEIRRRVDETTLLDAWLGHMHDHSDGVVVLLDRVAGFALDQVWLLLDPELDAELDPVARAFAPAVRAEIGRQLAPVEMEALLMTAQDRFQMNHASDVIHSRHQCGSAFYVSRVPWNGMSARDVATLQIAAVGSESQPCPDVTENEWLLFAARSGHLRRTPALQEALEHLIGFVATTVVVHEGRHAADDAALAGQPISCVGCPDGTSHVAALEGSAYLASFAEEKHGATAMYQACALDPAFAPDRAAIVAFLAGKLEGGGCLTGPPADLAEQARRLEREIYGRSDTIEVVDFPASLPVGLGSE